MITRMVSEMLVPKITFIVPCFNSGAVMEPCFKSLANQSLKDIEIIFVNDGSNDNTCEVISHFIKSDSRAKLINQCNQGIAAARLTGLRCARSDYVAFIDADDYIDLDLAKEAYEKFIVEEKIDALLFNFRYVKNGDISDFELNAKFPLSGLDVIARTIPSWNIYTNGVYKRECALEGYGKIRLKSTNSDEIANRLVFESCELVGKLDASYYYVQYDSSTSKYPSKSYITRLDSANWLRNYAVDSWGDVVSQYDADVHFVNEFCSLILKFFKYRASMPNDVRAEWVKGLLNNMKHLSPIVDSRMKSGFLVFLFDFKLVKKLVYLFFSFIRIKLA